MWIELKWLMIRLSVLVRYIACEAECTRELLSIFIFNLFPLLMLLVH